MFGDNGYLKPGMHQQTTTAIRKNFVEEERLTTARRHAIFTQYEQFISFLQSASVFPEQWVGGSFVSTKPEPGDIDLVSLCHPDQINSVPPELQAELESLFLGRRSDRSLCDSHVVVIGFEEHPKNDKFKTIYDYWKDLFGHDALGVPKGIVQTAVLPVVEQEGHGQ